MVGVDQHVAGPFPKWWQMEVDGVDAVEQVLAELPVSYHLVQIAVGGTDDAHVDGYCLAAAHAHDGAPLQGRE